MAAGRPPPRRPARRRLRRPGGARRRGPARAGAAIDRLAAADPRPLVFIALHGPFGEDGTVQAMLEAAGLAYTGSGVTASALGMDKAVFKRLVRGIGLPVVEWLRGPGRALARRSGRASSPSSRRSPPGPATAALMVKPSGLGSSVGITLVHEPAELPAALARHSATTGSRSWRRTWPAPATSRSA